MSHLFPDVTPLRTLPVIVTRKRSHDWISFLADEPGAWERGETEEEAIGCLLLSHADLLGVQLHREDARSEQNKQL